MDQHSREKIIIYSKVGEKSPKTEATCSLGQMFDIYLSSLLWHIYRQGTLHHPLSSSAQRIVKSNRLWRVLRLIISKAEDYNGNANVIHFAFNTWAHVCRRLTSHADINTPTLTLWADLAVNLQRQVTRRVAEASSVRLWRTPHSASCAAVCKAGISVRPWLSWNCGCPCRTRPPPLHPCHRSSCHQPALPVDTVAAHKYSWPLTHTDTHTQALIHIWAYHFVFNLCVCGLCSLSLLSYFVCKAEMCKIKAT